MVDCTNYFNGGTPSCVPIHILEWATTFFNSCRGKCRTLLCWIYLKLGYLFPPMHTIKWYFKSKCEVGKKCEDTCSDSVAHSKIRFSATLLQYCHRDSDDSYHVQNILLLAQRIQNLNTHGHIQNLGFEK